MKTDARSPTSEQTLIFDKSKFTEAQARAWADAHGFKSSKTDVTPDSIRIRQAEPGAFRAGSFRTIELKPGVKAVIGHKR